MAAQGVSVAKWIARACVSGQAGRARAEHRRRERGVINSGLGGRCHPRRRRGRTIGCPRTPTSRQQTQMKRCCDSGTRLSEPTKLAARTQRSCARTHSNSAARVPPASAAPLPFVQPCDSKCCAPAASLSWPLLERKARAGALPCPSPWAGQDRAAGHVLRPPRLAGSAASPQRKGATRPPGAACLCGERPMDLLSRRFKKKNAKSHGSNLTEAVPEAPCFL